MILSHRWRFIFIKGRKIAGTSVEMALSTLCGPRDVVTPITARDEIDRFRAGGQCRNYAWSPEEEEPFRAAVARFAATGDDRYETMPAPRLDRSRYYHHMSLREVLTRSGEDLSGYEVLCVERSPYSKALTWANMQASYAEYAAGRAMQVAPAQLAQWMDKVLADGTLLRTRNIDMYRWPDGRLAARVLRYARLADELNAFLTERGAPSVALPHAKKGLLSDTLDPRALLRPDQIARLNELFREEFETFGYPMIEP
jgi:hypothetical protein